MISKKKKKKKSGREEKTAVKLKESKKKFGSFCVRADDLLYL